MLSRFFFLGLIFFKLDNVIPFGFLLGTGADFFQQLKLDFLDTLVKAFLFLTMKSLFYICY